MEDQDQYLTQYDARAVDDLERREWAEEQREFRPRFKPPRRFRANGNQWIELHDKFGSLPCRLCGRPWDSLHHIYPRGQGGDDFYENLVPLCGSGTTGCHGLIEAHDPVARAQLRNSLTLMNRLYLTRKLGHQATGWLDSQYPELAA